MWPTVSKTTSGSVPQTTASWTSKPTVEAPSTWRRRDKCFRKNLRPLYSPKCSTRSPAWAVFTSRNPPSALRNWRWYCSTGSHENTTTVYRPLTTHTENGWELRGLAKIIWPFLHSTWDAWLYAEPHHT